MSSALKNISLYIPHVFPNFDKNFVADIFQDVGEIDHIDFIEKEDRNRKNYNSVYIHFKLWFNNTFAIKLHNDLTNSGNSHVYYDDKWYWIVLPNTAKKQISGERKPRIDLGESKVINISSVNNHSQSYNAYDYEEIIEDDYTVENDKELDEIAAALEEQDSNLVYVDSRYIKTIEEENQWLRNEITQLRMALINMDQMYQAEAAKVRAFNINNHNV